MTIKRVTVKKNERGLLLRNGDFERVLQPGTHWPRSRGWLRPSSCVSS